jgi:hypothetical protein
MTTEYIDNKQYVYEVVVWDDAPVNSENTHPYYDTGFSGIYRNLTLDQAKDAYAKSIEEYDHVEFIQVLIERVVLKSK